MRLVFKFVVIVWSKKGKKKNNQKGMEKVTV